MSKQIVKRRKLTKSERLEVYRKTGGHCAYCGCVLEYGDMQVDHLVALNGWSEQGTDTIDNMLPACRSCNHYKNAMPLESFREMVENMPMALARDNVTYKNAVRFGLVVPNPHPVVFFFEKIKKVIQLDELPDCSACYEPTKRRNGIIFDCPGPGEFTNTYTCENEKCRRKYDAAASFILRREIEEKSDAPTDQS